MATAKPLNILQRINAVMKDVKYVQKTSSVGFGNSKYQAVSHDEVTKKLHPVLVKHGIVVVPRMISGEFGPSGSLTGSGNVIFMFDTLWEVDFRNIDNLEEIITVTVPAQAMDHGDKAAGKAASYAMKYALLKTFVLESGEDDEERVEGEVAPLSEDQVIELENLCKEYEFPVEQTLKALAKNVYQLNDISELRHTYFDNAKKRLKKKHADAVRAQKKRGGQGDKPQQEEKPAADDINI